MSPDTEAQLLAAVNQLNGKIDKSFGTMRTIQVSLARVEEKYDAHEKRHEEREDERKLTCPTRPEVEKIRADVDAVAGITRSVAGRVGAIEDKLHQEEVDDAREDGAVGAYLKMWDFVRREWKMILLVGAWAAAEFGFKK